MKERLEKNMKKTYNVEVDCAQCANEVEHAVNNMDEIKSAQINFMLGKMTIEFDDNLDEKKLIKKVIKTGKKEEPDFEIEI